MLNNCALQRLSICHADSAGVFEGFWGRALQVLHLDDVRLDASDLRALTAVGPLRCLRLYGLLGLSEAVQGQGSGVAAGDAALAALLQPHCASLQDLAVVDCRGVTERCLQGLHLPALVHLSLGVSPSRQPPAPASSAAGDGRELLAAGDLPSLRVLRLARVGRVGGGALAAVRRLCASLPLLRELDLFECDGAPGPGGGEPGSAGVSEGFFGQGLQSLVLDSCPQWVDAGTLQWVEAMPALLSLSICGTSTSGHPPDAQPAGQALRLSHPGLLRLRVDGVAGCSPPLPWALSLPALHSLDLRAMSAPQARALLASLSTESRHRLRSLKVARPSVAAEGPTLLQELPALLRQHCGKSVEVVLFAAASAASAQLQSRLEADPDACQRLVMHGPREEADSSWFDRIPALPPPRTEIETIS